MMRRIWSEAGVVACLLLLPLLLFAPVALGPKTLVPADILFQFEPFRAAAGRFGIAYPQNHLVADLILENYVWKRFVVQALQQRELPLWDPYLFAGHPFLANGQHSALYPLSVVFYVLPLWRAFGVFTWLQLGLAGVFAYLFARVLGIGRLGGLVAGITFQFSGFMVVSVVHPMIIAGASWLAFILAMVELVVRRAPVGRQAALPWALLGALGLGCQLLAGHAENTYFVLLVTAAYALWRVGAMRPALRPGWRAWRARLAAWAPVVGWLALLAGLGLALGAVQFVPLYEVVVSSFRGGEAAASLSQVLGWAYPWRRLITFAVPNFFGNPAHHGYLDVFTGRWTPALAFADGQYITWDVKNYVEGGAYLGLLPLLLAALALWRWLRPLEHLRAWRARGASQPIAERPVAPAALPFFALLALFSLGCIFGTPLYALVYALPLLKQSHSPFRWVFPLTLAVAVLAGFGVEAVRGAQPALPGAGAGPSRRRLWGALGRALRLGAPPGAAALLAGLACWGGLATLAALAASRALFAQVEPLVEWLFRSLALADTAFPDARAFYSYEVKWVGLFGVLLTASGLALRASLSPRRVGRWPLWQPLMLGVLLADFWSFGWGTNPAVDPALLGYTPPVVEFLRRQPGLWRYATFTPPGTTKTLNANSGMLYDLQTVAGYDSLFSADYAAYMGLIEEQDEQQYNRIASLRQWSSLDSPLLDLLNVQYIVTEVEIPNPARFQLVYQDEAVRVYRNMGAMERAFTLPLCAAIETDDLARAVQRFDLRAYVALERGAGLECTGGPRAGVARPQAVTRYTLNEVELAVAVDEPSWLVLSDAYFAGWRATIRPLGDGEDAEQQVLLYRVNGVLRGVRVEPGAWTVRFRYSPDSVKLGAFGTFIALMTVLFLAGLYLWRFLYRQEDDVSTVRRVAKNSIAPIVINLFTRSIEMAFAALMARILGPVGNGRYATAVSVYLWFDIIANFGLDMLLMREVARDRAHARRTFIQTTALRVLLFAATAPLAAGFLAARQALPAPLAAETVWAVALLVAGLLPGSLANGLAALFRGCERHEIPAAIQTVTTIIRVTLGVLALAGGLGIVGLAGAAIVTNLATLAILGGLARRSIWTCLPPGEPSARGGWLDWPLGRAMLAESWPLMASLLLQALFPGVNVLLLQSLRGDAAVGWYDAARKWVDALQLVPSFFTFAVFPVVSRQAAQDREGLRRSVALSIKLLTLLTLPAALTITLLATPLVGLLSGQRFLPQGAHVLRLLIWSILFGWVNSLVNYVLIALGRQRFVLWASGARVLFTVAANFALVGRWGPVASAAIMVGGELLLAALFLADLRRSLGGLFWRETWLRPLAAGLVMGAAAVALARVHPPLALVAGLAAYGAALVGLRVLSPEERAVLAPLLPRRR